jgi:hypothetical protein
MGVLLILGILRHYSFAGGSRLECSAPGFRRKAAFATRSYAVGPAESLPGSAKWDFL